MLIPLLQKLFGWGDTAVGDPFETVSLSSMKAYDCTRTNTKAYTLTLENKGG